MAAAADRLGILAANPFFGALPETDLARIAPLLREVSVPPGDFLLREGDRAVEVFIIDDGEVQVLKRHPSDGHAAGDQPPRARAERRRAGAHRRGARAPRRCARRGRRGSTRSPSPTWPRPAPAAVLRTRLTQAVTRRLRDTNELTAQALALQLAMGRFLTFVIFLLSLYAYVLSGLSRFAAAEHLDDAHHARPEHRC